MSGKWNLAQLKSMLLESLFIALPESVLIDHEWQQANGDSLRETKRDADILWVGWFSSVRRKLLCCFLQQCRFKKQRCHCDLPVLHKILNKYFLLPSFGHKGTSLSILGAWWLKEHVQVWEQKWLRVTMWLPLPWPWRLSLNKVPVPSSARS